MPFNAEVYLNDTLLSLPLVVMLLTGIVTLIISAGHNKWTGIPYVTLAGLLVSIVSLVMSNSVSSELFSGMLLVNDITRTTVLIISILAVFLVLISKSLLDKHDLYMGEFYVLLSFAMTGMIMMLYSNDLIMVFIGIETMSIPFYVLAALSRSDSVSNESGMKYFLIGSFATGFLLYGIALIYGASGSTRFLPIATQFVTTPDSMLIWAGFGLFFIGFLFKIGAAPFHFWAPDVYQGAPTASSAVLAVLGKVSAFITFALVVIKLTPITNEKWSTVVITVSVLSIIIGNLTALPQNDIKRILGFSSVAHAGYILMAFVTMSEMSYNTIIFYSFVYGLMTLLAFSSVGLLENQNGNSTLDSIKGLGYSNSLVAAGLTVSLFSLMGLPPFGGFTAKYLLFTEVFRSGHVGLVITAIAGSMISVYYYLKIIVSLYTKTESAVSETKNPFIVSLTITLLIITLLISGVYPSLLTDLIVRS